MAHAYQGIKGILATGIVGGLFTLVVLISGSLWPAIVLHALVDIEQGLIAWLVLRRAKATNAQAGDEANSESAREQASPLRNKFKVIATTTSRGLSLSC
jgi:hypothetical protein